MTTLVGDLMALLLQRQTVDLHHVVKHAGKHGDHIAIAIPVEPGLVGERVQHQAGQVDGPQQAAAVGGEGLFAAVVGVQAIGVKGIDARNLHVVHILHAIRFDSRHSGDKALPVQTPFVARQRLVQSRLFGRVGKTYALREFSHVGAADHQFVLRTGGIQSTAATTVGQQGLARGSALAVQGRVDTQTQKHALHRLQCGNVRLCQPHADTLGLRTLDRAIGIKQAAQQAAVEIAGRRLHLRRNGFCARCHAEPMCQLAQCAGRKPVFVAPCHFLPTGKIGAVRQAARSCQRCGHDPFHPVGAATLIDCKGAGPHREHGLVRLQRAIANQQPDQVTLVTSISAGPLCGTAVVVEQHLVAGRQFARCAPFGFHAPAIQAGDATHTVVGSKAQRRPFPGLQTHNGFGCGAEKAFRATGVVTAVHTRKKRRACERGNLPGTFAGLHPGIRSDTGIGRADIFQPPVVVHLVDAVDENEARLGEVVG